MTTLSLIVAVAHNRVIGLNNTLPWHLPEDLKRFRSLTMGHCIVMGRKTYESLGRLLPGRTTVIVTRNRAYSVEGAWVVYSLEEALQRCQHDEEIFLIGGAELYTVGLTLAQRLYLTEIDIRVEGDAFFPALNEAEWSLISEEHHRSENGLNFAYKTFERSSTSP